MAVTIINPEFFIKTPLVRKCIALAGLDAGLATAENPVSSHMLKILSMANNSLLASPQQLVNLFWPVTTNTVSGNTMFTMGSIGDPIYLVNSLQVGKRPWLNTATVRVHMKIPSGATVKLGVRTTLFQDPFDSAAGNYIDCAGAGSFADYGGPDSLEFRINEGTHEMFSIVARFDPATTLETDTGTYGSPMSTGGVGSPLQGTDLGTIGGTRIGDVPAYNKLYKSGSTWNVSNLVNSGTHGVWFTDSSGNGIIGPPRKIIAETYPGSITVGFTPALTSAETKIVLEEGIYFHVVTSPFINVANINIVASRTGHLNEDEN